MNPLPADRALEQFFLDCRCKLLDVAATLDRIDRGTGKVEADPRRQKIDKALKALLDSNSNRAELIQQIFSLDYDPRWTKPKPRY